MTTVTMNTIDPTAQPVGVPPVPSGVQIHAGTASIIDARGRKLTVKRPTLLERMKLASLLGAEDAQNRIVFMNYFLASCVTEIDGEFEAFPTTRRQADALLGQLDDDGITAAMDAWSGLEKAASLNKAAAGN